MNEAHDQPKTIDRYKIREVLGTGAMGSVYGAWDPKLQREVAIKVVSQHLSRKDKSRERFEREARALAAVAHPNIVEIYDYSGPSAEALYVVIERLDGEDLYAALHRRGKMPESIAAAVGHDLCLALEAAHAAGLIHRDLKPENVFLNRGGRVVLTDFGIVKAVRGNTTVRGYREKTEVIGTPGFMAPEQMRGKALGPSIDLYALGALLYNIVTQRMPFEGGSPLAIYHAAQQGQYDDPRNYSPNLSEGFCAVIRACLQPLPGRRPASALDVRLALKQVLDDAGVTEVRDELAAYIENPESRRRFALARAIKVQSQKLKVASLEHDAKGLQRAQARLRVLEPKHPALRGLSSTSTFVFGLGTHRTRLKRWSAAVRARGAANLRQLRSSVQRRHGAMRLPAWVFAGCLVAASASLALGLLVRPKAPQALTMSHPAAKVVASLPQPAHHLPVIEDNPTGLPALLRAPHPAPVGPYRLINPSVSAVALLDIRMGQGLHLLLDGKRLTHRSYTHLCLRPGRHTVDYVNAQGHHVRRVVMATAGERIHLKVDAHRQTSGHHPA